MLTAVKDTERSDNLWRIYEQSPIDGEDQPEALFEFHAPASWTDADVLANWQRVRDEANGILSPEALLAQAWTILRVERDRRLIACDWTQLSDAPVDQFEWATYRQALRDLPENTVDPANPPWPEEPQNVS